MTDKTEILWRMGELLFAKADSKKAYIDWLSWAMKDAFPKIDADDIEKFFFDKYYKGKKSQHLIDLSHKELNYVSPDTTFAPLHNESYIKWRKDNNITTHVHITSAVTGGAEGGNCWGDCASVFSTGESADCPVKEFVKIHNIDISFSDYLKAEDIIYSFTESHNEYYGNHTNVQYKFFYIDKLFEIITK